MRSWERPSHLSPRPPQEKQPSSVQEAAGWEGRVPIPHAGGRGVVKLEWLPPQEGPYQLSGLLLCKWGKPTPPPASSSEKRQKGDSVTAGTQPALLSSSAPGMTHVSTLDLRVPSFHLCFPRDETDSPTLLPLEKVPGKGFDWPNTGDCNKLWTNHGG